MRKLAIYGLAGAGKSTTCRAVLDVCHAHGLTTGVVKLAAPLYRLQAEVYTLVGRTVEPGQQDQLLLRALAEHLRRLSPSYLVEDFLARIGSARDAGVEVVVTDDLKDTAVDYPRLVDAGFRFCHVTCPAGIRARRLGARADLTQMPETTATWGFDRITPDWTLHNDTDSHQRLRAGVEFLLEGWPT